MKGPILPMIESNGSVETRKKLPVFHCVNLETVLDYGTILGKHGGSTQYVVVGNPEPYHKL